MEKFNFGTYFCSGLRPFIQTYQSKDLQLLNGIENGGLKMLDIEYVFSAQRVVALKKYFGEGENSWEIILDEFICNVGRKVILF